MHFPWAKAQLVFHSGWSGPLLLLTLMVAVAVSLWLNRPTRRALGRTAYFMLGAEALCAALLVLWMVNPRLRYEAREGGQRELALAIDRSLSMATRDGAGGRSRYEAARELAFTADAPLARQLGEFGRLRTYTFGAALEEHAPASFPPQADPTGFGTNIKGAIEALAAQARAKKLQAAVLLSDGVHTEPGDPIEAARQGGVPIFTIGLGRPEAAGSFKNIGVTQVDVPTRVTVNQEVELKIELEQEGFEGASVPLELRLGGQLLASQTVKLARRGRQEARLKFTPDRRGTATYTVGVTHQEGDAVKEDDAQAVTILAADSKLKVLYVEGSLRWIYKFLKRIIEREQTVQADCVILTGGGRLTQQGQGQGNVSLRGGLPADLAGMQKYDAIVLGDFPRALLDEAQLKLLDEYVKTKKGGLLVIGGPLILESGDYAGSTLEAMLPATLNPQSAIRNPQSLNGGAGVDARAPSIANPSLTSLGRGSTVLKGLEDFFPKLALRRVYAVAAPKPGAEVWLESGVRPLLLAQRYGEGRTMLLTSDDLWAGALRESGKVEASPTGRFWLQALAWVAQRDGKGRDDDPLLMARCDKSFYAAGETVAIDAQLRKPKQEGGAWGTVKGEVRAEGQVVATLAFAAPDAQGRAQLEWKPTREGPFTIALAGEQGAERASVECKFMVGRPFRELERKGLDEDLLREIARASGGAYFSVQSAGGVAEALERSQAHNARIVEKDLLDSPVVFVVFLMLAGGDWIFRRKRNLV